MVGVLLVGTSGFDARGALQEALEPFAVALVNDQRLHELARLREPSAPPFTPLPR